MTGAIYAIRTMRIGARLFIYFSKPNKAATLANLLGRKTLKNCFH